MLVDHPSATGEGPLWHEENQTLNWVDIPAGHLFRFDPSSGRNDLIYRHSGQLGGYTFQADGSLVLFGERGSVLRLIGDDTEPIISGIDAVGESRFNDVIADPEGRIFAGTMPIDGGPAHLYRIDPDGTLTLVFDDLTLGNGMGFSPDLSRFYLTDSNSRRIFSMPYNRHSGELGEREVFLMLGDDEPGVPDGMAVDSDGCVWSARWDGHGIYKYSPEGHMIGKVEFPVRKVSSLTFGGGDYRTGYVTTAGGGERGESEGFLAGSLFSVDLRTRGRAPFRSRIGM